MGMTYKRGTVWWVKYYRNGRPIRESSHSSKESDVITLLKLREGDIAHGLPVDPKLNRIRFDEAADDLRGEDDEREERRYSNGEIDRELTTLKRILNLARQNGKLMHVPHVPMLKERNVRTGFFEREQIERISAHVRRRSVQPCGSPTSPAGGSRASPEAPVAARRLRSPRRPPGPAHDEER